MPTSLKRPKHLGIPDEITRGDKLFHIYPAHTNCKRLVESLIWLLAYYNVVELSTSPNDTCGSCESVLICSGHFINMDFEDD